MGSGASSGAGAPNSLSWPEGARALLAPGWAPETKGLKYQGPEPCREDGVPYWQLGGPSKARLRITDDEASVLRLGPQFTVALVCRAGAGEAEGYDSLLLGEDNKHWLALKGGEIGTVSCVEGESGKSTNVKAGIDRKEWVQLFLRPTTDGGTSLLGADSDGLVELGCFPTSLIGSKLRNGGWATNEVHLAAVGIWDRCLSWAELSASVAPQAKDDRPAPAPAEGPAPTSFQGRVVDLKGEPISDVLVSWSKEGKCFTDEEGRFSAMVDDDDAETTVPDDGASQGSAGSDSSWMSLSFQCEGFAPMASPVAMGSDNSVQVIMRPISASATLDASVGGSVVDPASGSSVSMPPNVLAYPDGRPVEGPVTVALSIIDVTDPAGLASMPGDFSAVGADGSEVKLQSLGAAWIGATDEQGTELEMREGSKYTLDLHTNAKANAEKLGTLPEMWSFDYASGKWILEPSAMKVNGEDAPNAARPAVASSSSPPVIRGKKKGKMMGAYEYEPTKPVTGCMSPEDFMKKVAEEGEKSMSAEVSKLGYINCDLAYHHPQRAVMMKGLVLNSKRQPMPEVQIWGTGRDYQGRTPDATAADGRFGALIAQFDSEVDIEVQFKRTRADDATIEVYFPSDKRTKIKDKALADLMRRVPGQYQQEGESDGQPLWVNQRVLKGRRDEAPSPPTISWDLARRRWLIQVGDEVVFLFTAGDEPGSPCIEQGWQAASSLAENVHPPIVTRASDVMSSKFGPFRTGPPGEFVDVGELVVDA